MTTATSTVRPPSSGAFMVSSEMGEKHKNDVVRLRQQTRNLQARYPMLFEHPIDAIAVLDPIGRVLDVNRRWEEITGEPRDALIGRNIAELSPAGYEVENTARYRETAKGVSGRDSPVAIKGRDGAIVYMDFTTTRLSIDGEDRILGIGRDVTDFVESQRQLEASERKYRSLLDNIPEVLWSATNDMKLTFVSGNVAALCGFTAEEVLAGAIGEPCAHVHPEDRDAFEAAFHKTVEREAPMDIEYRWQHRDGRWLWIHCRGVAGKNGEGVACVDGIFSDVTSRKLLEERISHAAKVEAIGQLTAGIAHDFNNVLAVIMTNSDYILDRLEPGETREVVSEILDAARRGSSLTSSLLAFGRRQEVSPPQTIDPNLVIADVERIVRRTFGRAIAVSTEMAPVVGKVRADAGEIAQVLMNLAVNAKDAMKTGRGSLEIATRNVEIFADSSLAAITKSPTGPSPGRYVAISVKDTGVGMDPATRARLFEPFFTTKGPELGTGLGLSVSYGIVRRYGGHIDVESAPDVGTTFTVFLPAL